MPSYLHEALIEMFRDRPALAAELLSGPSGVTLPEFQGAQLTSGDLTVVRPTEYRADAVVTLTQGEHVVLAVVVEVQLGVDRRKRRTWPAYVANLHARLGCPVMLLVICSDPRVASWCAARIVIGDPGLVLTPVVLGPAQIPLLTDPAVARQQPELAVLSALAHGATAPESGLFEAFVSGLTSIDHDHANLYTDVVLAALPEAAREYLEELMSVLDREYQSDFARRFFAEGLAEGETRGAVRAKARAVLDVLEARGIDVPLGVRVEILESVDLDRLNKWIRLAVKVSTADELIEED